MHADDVQPILRAVTENLLLEIQKTFDFFKATAASERIDRILVSGGTSRVERLRRHARRPVRRARWSRSTRSARSRSTRRKFGIEHLAEVAPTSAVAVGLALRRAGDR